MRHAADGLQRRRRAASPGRNLTNGLQELLDAAQRSCERSRAMIEASRTLLERHEALMASLRASASAAAFALPETAAVANDSANGDRRPALDLDDEVVVGPLRLLPLRRAVTGDLAKVLLTPAEWQLLAALLNTRASVLSRSELATKAWGPGFADRHGEVEVYVSRLRRKLARAGGQAGIETVRGRGYRLTLGDDAREEVPAEGQVRGGAA